MAFWKSHGCTMPRSPRHFRPIREDDDQGKYWPPSHLPRPSKCARPSQRRIRQAVDIQQDPDLASDSGVESTRHRAAEAAPFPSVPHARTLFVGKKYLLNGKPSARPHDDWVSRPYNEVADSGVGSVVPTNPNALNAITRQRGRSGSWAFPTTQDRPAHCRKAMWRGSACFPPLSVSLVGHDDFDTLRKGGGHGRGRRCYRRSRRPRRRVQERELATSERPTRSDLVSQKIILAQRQSQRLSVR